MAAHDITAREPGMKPEGESSRGTYPDQPLPFENGDRLTRHEFERRYEARPDIKKAELVEGRVCMPSPVRFASHGKPHSWIMTWLGTYCAAPPGVQPADNVTVRLDLDNESQPDALLRLEPEAGGLSRISDDDYVEGAPEFIVEIAARSASYDLHDKLQVYRRNGVQEYLVWRVSNEQIDYFVLEDGEYKRLTPDLAGILQSRVFPGLRLAVAALIAGDMAQVLSILQSGLGTAEHEEFVRRLHTKPE